MVVVHQNLPRLSDELVELDNGALARSLTPYSKLSFESILGAASNCKITSRVSRKLNELLDVGSKDNEDENGEPTKRLHQLGQIFEGKHLAEGGIEACFHATYETITAEIGDMGLVVSFQDRLREGFLLLSEISATEQERVDQWIMEDSKDGTFDILNKLTKKSRDQILKVLEEEEVPYFTHQVIKLREWCRREQGDDREVDMISFLKGRKKKHPDKPELVTFTPKRGEALNILFRDDDSDDES